VRFPAGIVFPPYTSSESHPLLCPSLPLSLSLCLGLSLSLCLCLCLCLCQASNSVFMFCFLLFLVFSFVVVFRSLHFLDASGVEFVNLCTFCASGVEFSIFEHVCLLIRRRIQRSLCPCPGGGAYLMAYTHIPRAASHLLLLQLVYWDHLGLTGSSRTVDDVDDHYRFYHCG
jgi:hypothetical protein